MNYLVTGATGSIGSLVVDRLLQLNHRPRVFVRDPKKAQALYGERVDIAVGDLTGAGTLKAALRGIDVLLLINTGPSLAARDELAAHVARTEGVRHLVKLSTMDVQQGVGTGPWHAKGESAIRASGIGYTFVQPAGFMTNALDWARSIQTEGVVRSATGAGKIAFIHPDDIADVATVALTKRTFDGESLPISGPEPLSYAEMAAKIGAEIGKPITFWPLSEEQTRQQWMERGESEESIEYHLSIFQAIREGRLAAVTNNVERVLGRAPTTFDQWARENADAFR
jgi:uncharacterized protein YbjT (DUF2867 family)